MEQSRLVIAIVLSFLVLFLWEVLFVDKEAPLKQKQNLEEQQTAGEEPYAGKTEIINADRAALYKDNYSQPLQEVRKITVDTPLYSLQISEKGAVCKSFVLKNYRERVNNDSPLKEMVSDSDNGMFRTGFAGNSLVGINDAVFLANIDSDSIQINSQPYELSFSWISPEGVVVDKTFSFFPETYIIGLNVTVKNGSDRTIKDNLTLSLANSLSEEISRYGFEGPSAYINNKLEQIKIKKIKDKNVYTGQFKWIALETRYFISSIMPKGQEEASMRLILEENNILENQYVQPVCTINPGTQRRYEYNLFMGPKSVKILKTVGHDLDKAIYFGMFDIIAKPCLWLMNFIYEFIPNYGIAIIMLTVFTKLILWPLGTKSYRSMNEMKKIQPLMTEIREKYKGDKKKMNEEMMSLYKVYKINPMGGCLPMIVQIPVFFALYRMLYEAIELRHAPFFGWINDLSAPDRLFNFGFSIPFMEPPYGIPVLTIIMGGTMFLQQKMSPPPGDPAQAKMMMFLPIIFTVIFINFSSGLVLYWLVNNILSIAQQHYISKTTA